MTTIPAQMPSPALPMPTHAAPQYLEPATQYSDKDYTTALLLSFFLGVFGVDRFYLGHTGVGIANFSSCSQPLASGH